MMTKNDFRYYQLSTTADEENDETEYPIDPDKKSPSVTYRIETDLASPIAEVYIIFLNVPVFTSAKVFTSLSSIPVPRKLSYIAAVTVVAPRSLVDIVTRAPIDKENHHFNLLLLQFTKC